MSHKKFGPDRSSRLLNTNKQTDTLNLYLEEFYPYRLACCKTGRDCNKVKNTDFIVILTSIFEVEVILFVYNSLVKPVF